MTKHPYYDLPIPNEGSLHRMELERDACGVGFVAKVDGTRSHEILELALGGCRAAVVHRGATRMDNYVFGLVVEAAQMLPCIESDRSRIGSRIVLRTLRRMLSSIVVPLLTVVEMVVHSIKSVFKLIPKAVKCVCHGLQKLGASEERPSESFRCEYLYPVPRVELA